MDNDTQHLNAQSRAAWDAKADFWDAMHGDDGNVFHRTLIGPPVERLLSVQPGERILDVACGSGVMARRLAELGAHVTGVDFSAKLIERATERGTPSGHPIDYRVVDATDEAALLAMGEGQYAGIVNTMALMDIADIGPLFRAAAKLLAPGGCFVVATAHPAFNSANPVLVAEQSDENGELITRHSMKLHGYLDVPPTLAVGAPGEPASHLYYHRPLHEILGEAFAAGLVMDGAEEPAFSPEHADPARPLSILSYTQFPPVLAMRFRVGAGVG